jgi:hypothetical protein
MSLSAAMMICTRVMPAHYLRDGQQVAGVYCCYCQRVGRIK